MFFIFKVFDKLAIEKKMLNPFIYMPVFKNNIHRLKLRNILLYANIISDFCCKGLKIFPASPSAAKYLTH